MVFKWKEEHTPLFLEHFKNYACLWDFKTEGYKNREVRAHATKCLIQDLNLIGVTEEDIKLKIKSIRTRYSCELSKVKRSIQSCCSPDDVYVPKLFWFKQADEFLNAVCVPRDSSSTPNFVSNISNWHRFSDFDRQLDSKRTRTYKSISEEQLQVTINESLEEEGQEVPQARDPLADTSRAPRSRKRCNDTPIDKEIKQQKVNDIYPVNKVIVNDDNKGTAEDEFDLFCRSLAVQLKNMPLHRALICQQDLLSVMVQERLQSINTTSPSHPQFNAIDR